MMPGNGHCAASHVESLSQGLMRIYSVLHVLFGVVVAATGAMGEVLAEEK